MTGLAVITGGARGIGAAIARRLQHDGYRMAVTYRANDAAAKTFTSDTGISAWK